LIEIISEILKGKPLDTHSKTEYDGIKEGFERG
jgi:hypothetical protein